MSTLHNQDLRLFCQMAQGIGEYLSRPSTAPSDAQNQWIFSIADQNGVNLARRPWALIERTCKGDPGLAAARATARNQDEGICIVVLAKCGACPLVHAHAYVLRPEVPEGAAAPVPSEGN